MQNTPNGKVAIQHLNYANFHFESRIEIDVCQYKSFPHEITRA